MLNLDFPSNLPIEQLEHNNETLLPLAITNRLFALPPDVHKKLRQYHEYYQVLRKPLHENGELPVNESWYQLTFLSMIKILTALDSNVMDMVLLSYDEGGIYAYWKYESAFNEHCSYSIVAHVSRDCEEESVCIDIYQYSVETNNHNAEYYKITFNNIEHMINKINTTISNYWSNASVREWWY